MSHHPISRKSKISRAQLAPVRITPYKLLRVQGLLPSLSFRTESRVDSLWSFYKCLVLAVCSRQYCRYIPHRHTERRLQNQTCFFFFAVCIVAQAERVQFLYIDVQKVSRLVSESKKFF